MKSVNPGDNSAPLDAQKVFFYRKYGSSAKVVSEWEHGSESRSDSTKRACNISVNEIEGYFTNFRAVAVARRQVG